MPHRDFPVTPPPEDENDDPITFSLSTAPGVVFTCHANMPPGALLAMYRLADATTNTQQIYLLNEFMEKVLVPESWDAFVRVRDDARLGVRWRNVSEIAGWIISEGYRGRPTDASSPSSPEANDGGNASTDGAQPAESTPPLSTSDV